MRSWAPALLALAFTTPALAQEPASDTPPPPPVDRSSQPEAAPGAHDAAAGEVSTSGSATKASDLLSGDSPRFAAPNGELGAGLSLSPEQKGRMYLEVGLGRLTQEQSFLGATLKVHMTSLSFILGGGVKVTPNLELEAKVPLAWAEYGVSISGGGVTPDSTSDSSFAFGNGHIGLSYLYGKGPLRLKAGGAVEYGPWTSDYKNTAVIAVAYAAGARAEQNIGLWAPEVFSLIAPARIEYGGRMVLGADVALGVHVPTSGNGDTEMTVQLDPGIGFYVDDTVLLGVRVPFVLIPTESLDSSGATYLAAEPYARFDLGPAFISARFTLNIDKPLGFSFDDGKVWGAHIGGGGSF